MGSMIDRVHKELLPEDIARIAATYHAWRNDSSTENGELKTGEPASYADIPGFCKSAKLEDIVKHDYVLTPGRYVGAAALEDDGIPFETKMQDLSQTLYAQMEEAEQLDEVIKANLAKVNYTIHTDAIKEQLIPAVHNSSFSCGIQFWQKETPGPLNRKRSRKGSRGQQLEINANAPVKSSIDAQR